MDGNRRFAQEHHMVTLTGHALGYDKLKEVRGSASENPYIHALSLACSECMLISIIVVG